MRPQIGHSQRLRITFAKGEEIKYISHLDLMRLWERALRRAGVPLLYSLGYNPRPKISIAFPLAVGVTGEREVLDVMLESPMAPLDFATSVRRQLPVGASLLEVEEVYPTLPPLQTQVSAAEYLAIVEDGQSAESIQARIDALLGSERLPRQRRGKQYDLRPLIEELRLESKGEGKCLIGMTLMAGEGGTGRPDEVLDELGLGDRVMAITRARLLFNPPQEG
jgi:radical SAM-linked protein